MADESHWTLPWTERSAEEARIFNPAFCGELIGRAVCEYHRTHPVALSMVMRSSFSPSHYTAGCAKRYRGGPTRLMLVGLPNTPLCWSRCRNSRGTCGLSRVKR